MSAMFKAVLSLHLTALKKSSCGIGLKAKPNKPQRQFYDSMMQITNLMYWLFEYWFFILAMWQIIGQNLNASPDTHNSLVLFEIQ